ncbi:hypothetical protein ACS0TY_004591 [Phlomoides rotata]
MKDYDTPCCSREFWTNLVTSFALVLFGGLTSGLSLGLLSHTKVDLEVLIKSGLPKHQKNAAKILPIVKNECFLLCTLLIAKSLATEALPIFLDRIVPFWCAILVSAIFVVAFVEVIPQVVCSRHGLSLGAKFTFFVHFLLFVFYPVSYPVSKVLDWLLGESRSVLFRRAELKTLVDLHGLKAGKGGNLTDDETTIISGALSMVEKTAKDAMTPLSGAFSLDINSKLDMTTMKMISSKGHSRIPIYSNNPANIIGLILVKNMMFYHPEDETPINKLSIRRIPRVYDDWPLYDVLKLFQEGHGHMAVVVKCERERCDEDTIIIVEPKNRTPDVITSHSVDDAIGGSISNEEWESRMNDEEVIGIITMEDVLEELLQEEIRDETDHHVEIHDKIRVKFLPSRRSSSSSSPGMASVYQQHWRTPSTSFSSYYHSPVIVSPSVSHVSSPRGAIHFAQ